MANFQRSLPATGRTAEEAAAAGENGALGEAADADEAAALAARPATPRGGRRCSTKRDRGAGQGGGHRGGAGLTHRRAAARAVRAAHRRRPGRSGPVARCPYPWKTCPSSSIRCSRVRKSHGDKVILDDVTLAFLPGAKIGVVGPNGTGKSTLLRMMAGVEQPSNGDAG